jgi:hypothetical protein
MLIPVIGRQGELKDRPVVTISCGQGRTAPRTSKMTGGFCHKEGLNDSAEKVFCQK